jgi:hypothetical protein
VKTRLRVDDCPAAGVEVLLGDVLDVTVEAEAEEAGREDVEGSGRAVLDDDHRTQILGDYLGEAGEVLDDGACVSGGGTVGRAEGEFDLLLLGGEGEGGVEEEAAEDWACEFVGEHANMNYTAISTHSYQ